tara:strand:+ start:130 stop:588 length:459 start_codon:yes stop_codon:yes gene_type:complete
MKNKLFYAAFLSLVFVFALTACEPAVVAEECCPESEVKADSLVSRSGDYIIIEDLVINREVAGEWIIISDIIEARKATDTLQVNGLPAKIYLMKSDPVTGELAPTGLMAVNTNVFTAIPNHIIIEDIIINRENGNEVDVMNEFIIIIDVDGV